MQASELYQIRESYEEMKAMNQDLTMTPFKFTVRGRIDTSGYSADENGRCEVRFNVVKAERLTESFQSANQELLKLLKRYQEAMV